MSALVVIKYRWTADALIAARRYHFRQACRPLFRLGIHVVMGMMLFAGLLELGTRLDIQVLEPQKPPSAQLSLAVCIAFVLVPIYWFVIRPLTWRQAVRKQFAKRADRDTDIEWEVSAERIVTKSPLANSDFSWLMVKKSRANAARLPRLHPRHRFPLAAAARLF